MEQPGFILTIGRQIGAGGLTVARTLSQELSVEMYDKCLLEKVATASGLSPELFEKRDEKPHRLNLRGLFTGQLFSASASVARGGINDEELFKVQSDVMRDLASRGSCIFVGRCAEYVLRDFPNLLSVFITAGMEERAKRIALERGIPEEEACQYIVRNEKRRSDYYNYFTFKKWGDSASYDLCISSSAVGGSSAVAQVIKDVMRLRGLLR